MSNNDLLCSKCKTNHHPAYCPMEMEEDLMNYKINELKDCLIGEDMRYGVVEESKLRLLVNAFIVVCMLLGVFIVLAILNVTPHDVWVVMMGG